MVCLIPANVELRLIENHTHHTAACNNGTWPNIIRPKLSYPHKERREQETIGWWACGDRGIESRRHEGNWGTGSCCTLRAGGSNG